MNQLRVDEIKTDRDVDAAEPLQGLTGTFKHPILVLEDGTLLDGLRRLKAAKDAGLSHIPVTIVTGFEQAAKLLAAAHKDRPVTPRRGWELIALLDPLAKAWSSERRIRNFKRFVATGERTPKTTADKTRITMAKALGFTYNQPPEKIRQLYSRAEAGDERAIELVDRVDSGEISVLYAYTVYKGAHKLLGDIRSKQDQKVLLASAPGRLTGVIKSLNRLGSPLLVDREQAQTALEQLIEARGQLTSLITRLRKELSE